MCFTDDDEKAEILRSLIVHGKRYAQIQKCTSSNNMNLGGLKLDVFKALWIIVLPLIGV